jgi:hypothetical protein
VANEVVRVVLATRMPSFHVHHEAGAVVRTVGGEPPRIGGAAVWYHACRRRWPRPRPPRGACRIALLHSARDAHPRRDMHTAC